MICTIMSALDILFLQVKWIKNQVQYFQYTVNRSRWIIANVSAQQFSYFWCENAAAGVGIKVGLKKIKGEEFKLMLVLSFCVIKSY